ncbi:hypothetical protein MBLNU459_g7587t2 [Dothideomycetes sp. NU459]
MKQRRSALLVLLALFVLLSTVLAATPSSFCKCTCFTNSTIIPLALPAAASSPDGSSSTSSSSAADSPGSGSGSGAKRTGTCADCNRQFCLGYNLPICKGAKEEDVFATCFQRDSAKDQAIVLIFLAVTVGLLVWAAVRPWVERWTEKTQGRHAYAPVNGDRN